MSQGTKQHDKSTASHSIDGDRIRAIVQQVIHRLQRMNEHSIDSPQSMIADRVVTAQQIEQLKAGTKQVTVLSDAVITPAARDAANDAGVEIARINASQTQQTDHSIKAPTESSPTSANHLLIDTDDPNRGELVLTQLKHRGVSHLNTRIVLSQTPAKTVVQEVQRGEVAVMISALDQVERFAAECQPTTWVLDTKQLNLTAAINVAARIANVPRTKP